MKEKEVAMHRLDKDYSEIGRDFSICDLCNKSIKCHHYITYGGKHFWICEECEELNA